MPAHRLIASVRPAASLDDAVVDEMWTLFDRYYADVARPDFVRDLREKDDVILLIDRNLGTLAGFSTIRAYERTVLGRRVTVVFSGDTICDARYWGQRALHGAFLRWVLRRKLAHPFTPLYWFLISKGYKTYLLLARNFPEHWPRHDRATPPWQAALLDELARERYGDAWQPERGILSFTVPHGRLRAAVAPIGEAERGDPQIRFFADRNPRAAEGDELCCLGRVDAALVLNYLGRNVRRALGARHATGGAPRVVAREPREARG